MNERAESEGPVLATPDHQMSGKVSEKDLTYRDFNVEDLMQHGPVKSTDISAISQLAWVPCGRGIHVLELVDGRYIRVEPDEGNGASRSKRIK